MNQAKKIPTHTTIAEPQLNPFVDFWNDILAPKMIRFQHILVGGLSHHSEAVFPTLPVDAGDRVLDVGCGFGDTAIALAQKVGPTGTVLGIDCCDAFLDLARAAAESEGQTNVRFVQGDAEVALPANEFDFVFSRFGTMFFVSPVAALRRMRKALKPGGKMVHIVWRRREDNPWLAMARDIVLQFLPKPGDDGLSCGPGPFSMASETVTRKQMEAAGFTDIQFQRVDTPVMVGRNIRETIDFQLALGPAGEVFREAGAIAEQQRDAIEAAMSKALSQQTITNEGIYINSSSWVISAVNP